MTTTTEALRLAREALDELHYSNSTAKAEAMYHAAIDAIDAVTATTGGSPEHLLQDQDRGLSRWLADKPDARLHAREAAAAIAAPSVGPVAPNYRGALADLVAEFKRVFPIYYYAEPWAHDRNRVLLDAQLLLSATPQAQPGQTPSAEPVVRAHVRSGTPGRIDELDVLRPLPQGTHLLYATPQAQPAASVEPDEPAFLSPRQVWRDYKASHAQPAAPSVEPVAHVSECEACFTPDVCQLRGTCDHYSAERLRVAKQDAAALARFGDWTMLPLIATEPMQKAMQRAVMLRKSMNDVWRAAISEAPESPVSAPNGEPDWDDVREQAEVATGLKVERHTYSIVIREVRKWLKGAAPVTPQAQPATVPLTDEQFDALWRAPMSFDWEHREFGRACIAEFCRVNGITPQEGATPPAVQAPLTEADMLDCVRSVGVPAPMGLTRDRGPYEVTEPTWFLVQLVRAIERRIGAAAQGGE